jgi:hypothetical protein
MEKNNNTDEFELAFQDEDREEEVEYDTSAFQVSEELLESQEGLADKSEVIILTRSYRIRGKVALVPGARLTDYMTGANLFVAVIEVEVRDKAVRLILTTPFLDVHRDQIELILPAEMATIEQG